MPNQIATKQYCNLQRPGAFPSPDNKCPISTDIKDAFLGVNTTTASYANNQLVREEHIKTTYNVTMSAGGGTLSPMMNPLYTVTIGNIFNTFGPPPTNTPGQTGKVFNGWKDMPNGMTYMPTSPGFSVMKDTGLVAQWREPTEPPPTMYELAITPNSNITTNYLLVELLNASDDAIVPSGVICIPENTSTKYICFTKEAGFSANKVRFKKANGAGNINVTGGTGFLSTSITNNNSTTVTVNSLNISTNININITVT